MDSVIAIGKKILQLLYCARTETRAPFALPFTDDIYLFYAV